MKKIILFGVVLTLILSAFTGCAKSNGALESDGALQSNETSKAELNIEPTAEVKANISGEITEISEDGKRIKVGDKWVIIERNTVFQNDTDKGIEAVSRKFKIGNSVEGYTKDDTNKEEVTAYQIYKNK